MAYGKIVNFDPVREIAFGSISGVFAAVGTALTDQARLITFQNATDEDLYVSFDGVTNNLRVASNSFKILDLTANKVRDDGFFLSSGTQISVRDTGPAPTTGDFWVEVMFADGGV